MRIFIITIATILTLLLLTIVMCNIPQNVILTQVKIHDSLIDEIKLADSSPKAAQRTFDFKLINRSDEDYKIAVEPTLTPSAIPTKVPTIIPSITPTKALTTAPTKTPTKTPVQSSKTSKSNVSNVSSGGTIYIISAYDLSITSCGKSRSNRDFGITSMGYSLKNQSRSSAMTIATDPRVIPSGKKVSLNFVNTKYNYLNGVYTARDTGGAIKGKRIDLFMGDFYKNNEDKSVVAFGLQKAYVKIIK